jgi:hypothetical protein
MIEVAIILSGISACLTAITSVFSVLAYAKVVGMEKSTHRIINGGMAPVGGDPEDLGPTGEELVNKMKKAFYPEEEGHV